MTTRGTRFVVYGDAAAMVLDLAPDTPILRRVEGGPDTAL